MQARYQSARSNEATEQSGFGARLRSALWLYAGFIAASAAAAALAHVSADGTAAVPGLGTAAVAAWFAYVSWQRSSNALNTAPGAATATSREARSFVQPIAPLSNG